MKDMSEEKESTPKFTGLETSEMCIQRLMAEIKSLESRLKEANKIMEAQHGQNLRMEQRLSQAEHILAIVRGCDMDNVNMISDLTNKLSQAEDKYKTEYQINKEGAKMHDELRNRLSHLMDVAGKMAGAVEVLANQMVNVGYLFDMPKRFKDSFNDAQKEAKLALAEWDGIKKEGKQNG